MHPLRLRSRALPSLLITLSILAPTTLSHSSPQSPPPQSPALKVLDAWTGQWTTHGKLYDTPFSHAGEITITMTCAWSAYGGYMICDHLFTGPSGTRNDLSIYTYNESDKSYKFCGFDRSGTPRATPLTIDGPSGVTTPTKNKKARKSTSKPSTTSPSPASSPGTQNSPTTPAPTGP